MTLSVIANHKREESLKYLLRSAPTGYYIEPTDRPLATTLSPLTLPLLKIKMARSAPTGYYLEPTDPDILTAVSSSVASVRSLIPNQFPHVDYYHHISCFLSCTGFSLCSRFK